MATGKSRPRAQMNLNKLWRLKRTIHRHRHRLSLRNDKLLHFDHRAVSAKLLQNNSCDFFGERLDQFPFASSAQGEDALGDGGIIDGFAEVIRACGEAQISLEVDGDEQP